MALQAPLWVGNATLSCDTVITASISSSVLKCFWAARIMYNKGPVDKVVRKSFLWYNSYRRDAAWWDTKADKWQWFSWILSHWFQKPTCCGRSSGWYPLISSMIFWRHIIRQQAVHLWTLSVCSKCSWSDTCMASNQSGGWWRKFSSTSPTDGFNVETEVEQSMQSYLDSLDEELSNQPGFKKPPTKIVRKCRTTSQTDPDSGSPTIHSWTHSSVRKEFLLRTTG